MSVVTEFWRMQVLKVRLTFKAIIAIIKVVIDQEGLASALLLN